VRRILGAALVTASLFGFVIGGGVASAQSEPSALRIDGGPTSAANAAAVSLDADLYLPAVTPAPAVVLAHGFGGSKESIADDARYMAEQGFVVLAYTARGFGDSTGEISLNSPDFEVADAQALINYLAGLPEVTLDAPGDPRIGFAGGSYGGALALMIAGYDERVDAIAADITWNDLQTSLFAQNGLNSVDIGVYKQLWSALFFSAGLSTQPGSPVTECGRFAADWCAAYNEAATTGTISPTTAQLMRASSPISITDRITAPTLLGGGQSDSLFPLAQTNANATQISDDVPVKVVWHAAGHDGGVNETDRLRNITAQWMQAHLADGAPVANDFEVSLVEGSALSDRAAGTVNVLTSQTYPGLSGDSQQTFNLLGPTQQVLAPAGGVPAAITSLPGAGGLAGLASNLLSVPLPGQSAGFATAALPESLTIIGASRAQVLISSDQIVDDVTLFASLRVISPDGRQTLPNGLVAPVRLSQVGPDPVAVNIELPAIVTEVAPGNRLAVVIATTDQGYRMGTGPAVLTVALGEATLTVPQVVTLATGSGSAAWVWPVGALLLALAIWIIITVLRPRPATPASVPELAPTPVAVRDLVQEFKGGLRAVDGVTFDVPPGVVLGLLGPNGAGKTTTMRMIMGLIRPTDGAVYVFGDRVSSGAPVLSRIGSFVEGPGFLPHLSGRANLDLYWRASGRSGDPNFDQVLDIAGLGDAINRKVRTYSQGMRQRLGIAQAMLGTPDILMLDEPTNGLDPPQIREMRQVVADYAATGRTVIISSHLLAEVEQTCSHVVVMNHGKVIVTGTVTELLAGRTGLRLEDVFLELVGEGHSV
jgi:ABC-2 type transport system ATP-binding protein